MKYNKKSELNNKLFLIGLGLLSAIGVGVTAATTMVYNWSSDCFDYPINKPNYNVSMKNMLVDAEAASAEKGKKINANITVENSGEVPMLVRISYINSDKVFIEGIRDNSYQNLNRNSDGKVIDSDGNVVSYLDLSENITDSTTSSEWSAQVVENSNFVFNSDDGHYYYKGILKTNESVQHLDSVTLCSGSDSSGNEQIFHKTGDYDTTDWVSGSAPSGTTESGIKKVVTFGNSSPLKLNLTVAIETIQATDKNFKFFEIPADVTAAQMKEYWTRLGKNN